MKGKWTILRLIPWMFGVFIEGILPSNLKLFNYGLSALRMKITSEEIILKFLLKFINLSTIFDYFMIGNVPEFRG